MAEQRTKRWKLLLTVLTLLALAGLIYAVRAQILDTISNLNKVNRYALLLIVPAQALNYFAYTHLYQGLFKILGHRINFLRMLRVVSELNFVNTVFPSGGVSGFSYFGVRMRRENVRAGQATLVQMMRFILVFVSFQVLLFTGLLVLAIGGQAGQITILIAGSLATLLLVGTLVGAYIIGSRNRINYFFTLITRIVNRFIYLFRPKNPETINIARLQFMLTDLHENYLLIKKDFGVLRWPLVYSLLASVAEISAIYSVYAAFGEWVNPGAVIIAYAIANFAGLISVLPGGVGIYEALMTAVLASAGVPAGVSIPVTIMYRVLSMTLQLPPGYFFYHRAINEDNVARS
jgi:uncharacterized protein (TIRG00374 family)